GLAHVEGPPARPVGERRGAGPAQASPGAQVAVGGWTALLGFPIAAAPFGVVLVGECAGVAQLEAVTADVQVLVLQRELRRRRTRNWVESGLLSHGRPPCRARRGHPSGTARCSG